MRSTSSSSSSRAAVVVVVVVVSAIAAAVAAVAAVVAVRRRRGAGEGGGGDDGDDDDGADDDPAAIPWTATAIASPSSSSAATTVSPMHPIGTLSSVYRLCVGTPRQGMLAPNSRGVLAFDERVVSKDSVSELGGYSHVYVVFAFHLNSNGPAREGAFGGGGERGERGERGAGGGGIDEDGGRAAGKHGGGNGGARGGGGDKRRQFPSKIAPPSLGGKRVGIFSTRTPHRPNPIGISLCKLDGVVTTKNKNKKKKDGAGGSSGSGSSSFSLLLSGLDLVDGTPVLDVKPYVPHYDCVGYRGDGDDDYAEDVVDHHATRERRVDDGGVVDDASSSKGGGGGGGGGGGVKATRGIERARVPHWVGSGLGKRRMVTFLPDASRFLRDLANATTDYSATRPSTTETDYGGGDGGDGGGGERAADGIASSNDVGRGSNGCAAPHSLPSPSSSSSPSLLSRMRFYGPHSPWRDTPESAVKRLEDCIAETLGADVRSAWQTGKARVGRSQAERSRRLAGRTAGTTTARDDDDGAIAGGGDADDDCRRSRPRLCTQQIDNLLVGYTVEGCAAADERSAGSGAEDVVVVHAISLIV
jgi:tRNA (Thr-GGU) A37 N-methylase